MVNLYDNVTQLHQAFHGQEANACPPVYYIDGPPSVQSET